MSMLSRSRLLAIAFAAASLGCAAVAFRSVALGVPWRDPWLFPLLVVLPGLASLLFALALALSHELRTNIALLAASAVVAIYVLETTLRFLPVQADPNWQQVAAAEGRPFDPRRRFDVVEALRAAGTPAYPSFGARGLRMVRGKDGSGIIVNGRSIAPLAQLRNSVIVDCNESGEFSVFRTDERGFNNPPGLWTDSVDLAAVGDSYIQGSCVDSTETLVANLRRAVPRTVGLGLGDSGPLVMLGMIKEFLPAVRPRDVFWFYYEGNDLRNLDSELDVQELRTYLDPGGIQGLSDVQDEIDQTLLRYVEAALDAPDEETEPAEPASESLRTTFRRWATLHRLRSALALANLGERLNRCCDVEMLAATLVEARSTVESWGGRLHFVYLPAAGRYYHPLSAVFDDGLRYRGQVLRTVHRLGVPIVDIDEAFRAAGDPKELLVNAHSHFNPAGYRVAAEAVVRHLEAERPAPSPASSAR